jgi:hypothetical protein
MQCRDLARRSLLAAGWCAVTLGIASFGSLASAQEPANSAVANPQIAADPSGGGEDGDDSAKTAAASKSSAPAHAALLKDAKTQTGMLTLYQTKTNVYVELMPTDYNAEYLVLISIARGISQGSILGGMSWGFGDDWVWQFRKIDDNVHIVRKNVRFKATKGSPESTAVENAYTDSVLFSIPAKVKGPKGGDLVDITSIFMSDLPQISRVLPGFAFSAQKSTWNKVKAFPNNVELEVAATYASAGNIELDTVPDSRGATINVHYSLSKIPNTGYQPRLADDRVGYFLTAVKDFSSKSDRDNFVRFVNRWDLRKADPTAELSPPVKPIKFWIEKTVPYKYRKPIYDGIYEWNKAFEKAGFVNAVIVDQQPDDATWDPEDVNYNTFRWITSNAGFAMGPSRVNPYTGQILDADIIFDADFLTFWKQEYEMLTPEAIAQMTGGSPETDAAAAKTFGRDPVGGHCALSHGMSRQFAFGAAAVFGQFAADPAKVAEEQEKLIMQGLKEVTMHEVGHTLGLRHNFKASKMLSLKEMQDKSKTDQTGLVASVMDYAPVNIVPKDWDQGDYYSQTLGPYDYWAIEYGYKQFSGGTQGELAELKKIAARSGEPQLAYATDEDTRSTDPDPDSNRFDMGSDAVEYAKSRAEIVQQLVPGLVERMTKEGDDYTQARRAFNILLSQHGQAMYFVSRYVGGMSISRSHKGDKDARPPITVIDAKQQREAFDLVVKQMLSAEPFEFPPEIYQYLASSNWSHWGMGTTVRKDFPVHDVVSQWQGRILGQLISVNTLQRMYDAELKLPPDADAFTTAELIEKLTHAIYAEVDAINEGEFTNRKPAINSLRRNLQRTYLSEISNMAMGNSGAPADCQTIAYAELGALHGRIERLLGNDKVKLDSYTRAHLQETASRIQKVLDASFTLRAP